MNNIPRHIAHFDLDAFFVSVEILKNTSLKGKPLIVGGDGERGIVAACSYEARKYGIESAMPAMKAKKLCTEAIFLKGNYADYSKYSRLVTAIIAESVPQFEKASIDEFYCDLSGMDKFFGVSQYAKDLRNKVTNETGLPISCGLSANKLVSKMATNEAKPNGFLEVPHGKETSFLWPLRVEKIPMVGKQTQHQLNGLGIQTIEELANTPIAILEKHFGKWGNKLWDKAHGKSESPVEQYSEQKSISHETTFDNDSCDEIFLQAQLLKLTEETAYAMRQENKLTGCVTVKIRYSDFKTVSRQEVIDYTPLDDVLLLKVYHLFQQLYNKKEKVRLLGVRFSHLIPVTIQMNLFDESIKKFQLFKTVDQIKNQFGVEMVTKARSIQKRDTKE